MISVCHDQEGLRAAALELMEEALEAPQREANERLAERVGDPERLLAAAAPDRALSPGYYMWLGYVAESIAQPLEAGIAFRDADLLADEITTLTILNEARAKFRRMHPPCSGCGKPLRNEWDKTCNDCQRAAAAAAREQR
jgi:hypothetical protein